MNPPPPWRLYIENRVSGAQALFPLIGTALPLTTEACCERLLNAGTKITFFEPDAYNRQQHRDIEDPEWARIVVYNADDLDEVNRHLTASAHFDVVVKASGVGVLDEYLEVRAAAMPRSACKVFWDVDAPATLERLASDPDDPFHSALPRFDLVFTYGGGKRVTEEYRSVGARECFADLQRLRSGRSFPRCTRGAVCL